ncbi:non-ribosomal peptide synthetase [Amycolatopsis sp. NBC_01286]|uniref:non-ribosomal peptide synthetase n=1 Tax=Amycolatopsis sp. NBC_01286 TaxID=2903560 RepID=UPI002E10E0E8|nr:non-ribosomal peptide synthetase [Amycolatopsis sp. NBC_01286]
MPVDGNPAVPELVLPRLFERAAALRPHRTALSGDGPEVSYADLNARANRLARTLRLTQVRDGAPAGLYLDRSADLVVALLAVLKAGGCVVPLNPAYPAKMIRHIVEETGLRTVVHQGQPSLAEADLPVRQAHVADLMEESASQDDHDLDQAPAAEDDAFVLFTSGSTGRPKGVRLAHRGLARLAVADPKLTITPDDCLVQLAAFSFAASGNEFWLSLLNGAELVLLPPGLPSLSDLRDVITKHGVSVLSLPCGLFNLLVDNELDALRQLRVIMVSGDFPSPAHLATAAEHTTAAIFNGYGCTENSAISSLYPITPAVRDLDRVPVGKPLTGVTMDVLDQDLKPCPPGDVGELCIGGTGVANGYLNLPDAQAGKFVDGGTRYRTGDLARLTPDGDVVLVGRSDSLVKIRGFRVETSAVELALKSFDDVEHAVVKAFGNEANEKSLVAFYTTWSGQEIGTGELIAQLADSLPEHMIPSDFRRLEAMPANLNGKIDRAALHDPRARPPEDPRAEKEQRMSNPLETVILQMWRDIIGSDDYSVTDPFVGHGGNSLHFVKFASGLQSVFAVEVRPEDVFRHGTVRKLAEHVESLRAGAAAR